MTTISFNDFAFHSAPRAPKLSFAARLAALQARQELAPDTSAILATMGRFSLAAIPFLGLAWVFVTI